MGTSEPESRTDRLRATRRRRRRTAVVLTTGLLVGLGAVAATSSRADTRLLHILDAANEPAPTTAQHTAKAHRLALVKPTGKPTPKPAPKPTPAPPPVPSRSTPRHHLRGPVRGAHPVPAAVPGGRSSAGASPAATTAPPAWSTAQPGTSSSRPRTASAAAPAAATPSSPASGTAPPPTGWQISNVVEASAWTSSQDADDDVAFAVVAPLNGHNLESMVGSYTLDTDAVSNAQVQLTGYPEDSNEPISCTGDGNPFTATQLQIYCTAYTSGTSGSGWISGYDPVTGGGNLIGVIGGYETGGDTPDVSYSPLFDGNVRALYDQAVGLTS
ncbi:hypothetical protein GXW82_05405 [Streptacidiphilus sp. 4-A2]|nr:hypothetical protein [Streptacidiphilus sp. 4-A2]